MSKQISESFLLTIILTLSGGFMDAYSYLCRGEVFANAQTGNLLLFGVNLTMGKFDMALQYICPVAAFVIGIVLADIFRFKFQNGRYFHWRQMVVAAEALLLMAVAFMPQSMNLLANSLTSLACGSQVESFRKVKGNGMATTMCIGNLRMATQSLCSFYLTRDREMLKKGLMFFLLICIFIIGAVLGNISVMMNSEKAIIVSSILLIAAGLIMFINKED